MDLSRVFTQDNVFTFWPKSNQTEIEKYYSSARFIVYGTLLAFALNRNVKILILGTVLFFGLFLYSRNVAVVVKNEMTMNPDDPFGNFSTSKVYSNDMIDEWSKTFADKRNAVRNFYTAPSDDMDKYLEFVHGGKDKPFCRQNQSACNADNNPRFMDRVQMRPNRLGL